MRKALLTIFAAIFVLGVGQMAQAAECVEVDVELTPEVAAGEQIDAFFELVNCGDEADTLWLQFSLELFGQTVDLPQIPAVLGAGETISREFSFVAPPAFVGETFGVCVTATAGDATASDCASTTILEGDFPTQDRGLDFAVSLNAADCVELDFELSDTVVTKPGDFFAEGFFELTNCGDTAALVSLALEVENMPTVPVIEAQIPVGAGQTISRELRFPVPPAVPGGDYNICVTATAGGAMATSCETITIVPYDLGDDESASNTVSASNHPNPFNPSTNISYSLPAATNVSVTVYNTLGQQVQTLVNDEYQAAGEYTVTWDGTDNAGNAVSTGMYFYRIETDDQSISKKMLMIK